MTAYLLDTSTLIDIIRNKPDSVNFLQNNVKEKLFTSIICVVELLEGANLSKNIKVEKTLIDNAIKAINPPLLFDNQQAEIAGQIRSMLRKIGQKIDDFDTLIAASAIATNSTLVTTNLKHFTRIPNLRLLNVSKPNS